MHKTSGAKKEETQHQFGAKHLLARTRSSGPVALLTIRVGE